MLTNNTLLCIISHEIFVTFIHTIFAFYTYTGTYLYVFWYRFINSEKNTLYVLIILIDVLYNI